MRGNDESTGITLPEARLINQRAVPALLPEQYERFTSDSLRTKPVRRFDPQRALGGLRASDGESILAVDIGGDKISASYFTILGTDVQRGYAVLDKQDNSGAGYLAALLEVREFALREEIPVGISFAGPTEGTRLLAGPNVSVFTEEFQAGYGGDFAHLFPQVELTNDAEAGIMAGALEAARRYPDMRHVIYIINGSGLGGSVLTANTIYAAEPGHIEVADRLNTFGQGKPCGLDGARHVCVEAVAASKAGVEDIWFQQTGEQLTGQEIAARYLEGEQLAFDLYDNSAHLTAHAIKGMASACQLLSDLAGLVIVAHGGIFHVPGYGDRLHAILEQDFGEAPRMLFTKDFSTNTCLEGAAIAVATRDF